MSRANSTYLYFVSFNINSVSRSKLVSCLSIFRDKYKTYPSILGIQECKSLKPPELVGYDLYHSLDSSVHGSCCYVLNTFKTSLIFANHNNVLLSLASSDEVEPFLVGSSYVPFSRRKDWREIVEPVLDVLARPPYKSFLWGIDFNHPNFSSVAEELVYTACSGKPNSILQSKLPSCRNVSFPDIIVGSGCSGQAVVLPRVKSSDHAPLGCKVSCCFRPLSETGALFSCNLKRASPEILDSLWASVDVIDISSRSSSPNCFFMDLELSFRNACVEKNIFQRCPDVFDQIRSDISSDIGEILNSNINSSAKLRKISNISNPSGSSFSFNDINSAIGKAEKLPILDSLNVPVSRSSFSHKPLSFSFSETWDIICCLNANKSSGSSFLSATALKRIPPLYLNQIIIWFERISKFGFPEVFRLSKVFGVAKSDGSCRPICVTSVLGKVYDCLLLNRIEPILSSFLPPNQGAYRRHVRGCEDHLSVLKVLSLLYPDLILVVTDFSKAFNTVPNSIILKALRSFGVSGTLLDAVIDALSSFTIVSHDSSSFSDFYRGVKQGGVSSGLIFTSIMISLSPLLDAAVLSDPVLLNGSKVTHLIFADDVILLALNQSDAKILSVIVENWTHDNGLVLNSSKCRILCGFICENLWYKCALKARYLGLTIHYDKSSGRGIYFSRLSSNMYYAYKLKPAILAINDIDLLRVLIKTFNSGQFGNQIVYSDLINNSRSVGEFCELVKHQDKFWLRIIKFFFRINSKTILSLPRVANELSLGGSRFGVMLLKHTSSYFSYVSNLPPSSFVKLAIDVDTSYSSSLAKARDLVLDFEFWPIPAVSVSWLYLPRRERTLVAQIFLGVNSADDSVYRGRLLNFGANREFSKLRKLARALLAISNPDF